jgi:hypothetical protein
MRVEVVARGVDAHLQVAAAVGVRLLDERGVVVDPSTVERGDARGGDRRAALAGHAGAVADAAVGVLAGPQIADGALDGALVDGDAGRPAGPQRLQLRHGDAAFVRGRLGVVVPATCRTLGAFDQPHGALQHALDAAQPPIVLLHAVHRGEEQRGEAVAEHRHRVLVGGSDQAGVGMGLAQQIVGRRAHRPPVRAAGRRRPGRQQRHAGEGRHRHRGGAVAAGLVPGPRRVLGAHQPGQAALRGCCGRIGRRACGHRRCLGDRRRCCDRQQQRGRENSCERGRGVHDRPSRRA